MNQIVATVNALAEAVSGLQQTVESLETRVKALEGATPRAVPSPLISAIPGAAPAPMETQSRSDEPMASLVEKFNAARNELLTMYQTRVIQPGDSAMNTLMGSVQQTIHVANTETSRRFENLLHRVYDQASLAIVSNTEQAMERFAKYVTPLQLDCLAAAAIVLQYTVEILRQDDAILSKYEGLCAISTCVIDQMKEIATFDRADPASPLSVVSLMGACISKIAAAILNNNERRSYYVYVQDRIRSMPKTDTPDAFKDMELLMHQVVQRLATDVKYTAKPTTRFTSGFDQL